MLIFVRVCIVNFVLKFPVISTQTKNTYNYVIKFSTKLIIKYERHTKEGNYSFFFTFRSIDNFLNMLYSY